MKKYLPWAAIVALLTGLALLPGPKAGASETTIPTLTGLLACVSTPASATWTANYTLTSSGNAGFWLYPDGGAPNSGPPAYTPVGTLSGLPATTSGGTVTFIVTGIPASVRDLRVDVLSYSDSGWHDLYLDLPIIGTCDPTPTPTTTVPVTPTTVLPGPVGGPISPPGLPTPAASPQAPLAFTGAPIWPEVALALFLIALGSLLVRRSVRHA